MRSSLALGTVLSRSMQFTGRTYGPFLSMSLGALLLLSFCLTTYGQIDPCSENAHRVLDNAFRSTTFRAKDQSTPYFCDRDLNRGWYRFTLFGKNAEMPTECQESKNCGAILPFWLNLNNQESPAVGETKRFQGCGAFRGRHQPKTPENCCMVPVELQVKNCGDFKLYFLQPLLSCSMSYCAEEVKTPCKPNEFSVDGFQPCRVGAPNPVNDVAITPTVVNNKVYMEATFTPPATNLSLDMGYISTWLKLGDHGSRTELVAMDTTEPRSWIEIKDNSLIGESVICEVQAYFIESRHFKSDPVASESFFAGINVVPSSLNLAEDGSFHMVTLQTSLPIVCGESEPCGVTVNLKTVDVDGKHLGDDIVLSRCSVRFTPQPCNRLHCGIETVLVTAVTDFTEDGDRNVAIVTEKIRTSDPIWNGYDPSDIDVTVEDRPTAQCYSFTDPHFITFDGRKYDYYKTGTFLLYKSTIRDFEVHNKLWPCGGTSNPISCNCGFVARENNDIISVDMCEGNFLETSANINTRGLFPLSPGVRIKESRDGKKITIDFPSGAFVRADVADWGMSITIQAPSVDFNHTIGLCGLFDGDPTNDFHDRDMNILSIPLKQGQHNEFVEQWRLDDGGLFNTSPDLKIYRPTVQFCKCGEQARVAPYNNTVRSIDESLIDRECGQLSNIRRTEVIPSIDMTSKYANNIFSFRKKKSNRELRFRERPEIVERNEYYLPEHPELLPPAVFDIDSTSYDIPYRSDYVYRVTDTIERDFAPVEVKWPTPTGITEQQAKILCEEFLYNTTTAGVCSGILKQTLGDAIEMCMTDVQVTDDLFWVEQSESLVENQCESAIVRDASLWQQDEAGNTAVRNIMDSLICPNDCSGRGLCTPVGCDCDKGYHPPDCSKKSQAPKIVNLENNGLCDTRFQNCSKIRVFGRRFKNRPNFACIVTPVSLTNELELTTAPPSVRPAVFINKRTVLCELPPIPVSPSSLGKDPEDGLFRWEVQVSFDGFKPSNKAVLTVYDSLCQECDWTGTCKFKDGTCLIEGSCYQSGARSPTNPSCRQCIPEADRLSWSIAKDNLAPLFGNPGSAKDMWTFVGQEFSYQVPALDPDGASVTFTLINDEVGMDLTPSGLLTWTADTPGERNVAVKITDECGQYINVNLEISAQSCDCENGGTCTTISDSSEGSGGYFCMCAEGYDGDKCEDLTVDNCASYPCAHGSCVNLLGGFECVCPAGYSGTLCEKRELTSCDPNPCYPGVDCFDDGGAISCGSCPMGKTGDGVDCADMCDRPCPKHFYCADPGVCKCIEGYAGFGCHIALCRPDCENNGRCIKPNVCQCANGYSGERCELAHCTPPCQNGAKCVARNVCSCKYGYLGPRCETMTCNKHCENGGVCSSPDVCDCKPGWNGPTCGTAICSPFCQNGGICIRPGECLCPRGFYGLRCEMATCTPPCENGGSCSRMNMCTCPEGYYGLRCEQVRCEPRCQNGGKCVRPNECSCVSGYRGTSCHKAICVSGCRNGGVCVQPNVCECPSGYTGLNCQTPICSQRCMYGGRCVGPNVCQCRRGYSGASCRRRSAYAR